MVTDCFWLLVLIGYVALNVIVYAPAVAEGDFEALGQFYDNAGNRCGTGSAIDFPLTYLPDLETGNFSDSYCVKKCPSTSDDKVEAFGATKEVSSMATSTAFTLCVPKGQNTAKLLLKVFKNNYVGEYVADIPLLIKYMPIFIITSVLLSLAYLYILKHTAGLIVQLVNAVFILGLGFFSYLLYSQQLSVSMLTRVSGDAWAVEGDKYLQYGLMAICPVYVVLYFCFLRSRMLISTGIIEAGADAVGDMPSTLLVSLTSIVSSLLTLVFWLCVTMQFLSMHIKGRSSDTFLYDLDVESDWRFYLLIFNVIYWTWFVESVFRFLLACMFTNWYYYQDGQNDLAGPKHSLSQACGRLLKSFGTIAVGSLVTSLASVLRLCIGWISHKTHEVGADSNFLVRWGLYLLNFLAWLFEQICQQFTKYAYIHASFTGDGFFTSAWTSMVVNLSNAGIFSTLQLMEELLIWGGKLTIILLNLGLAYALFVLDWLNIGFNLSTIPLGSFGLVALISYICSSAFLSLFDDAADTIMYCFFFDYDRKGAPPLNYPVQLKDYLEEIKAQKSEWDKTYYAKTD